MKKVILAGAAAIAATLALAAPAQANSDVCVAKANAGDRATCQASTRDDHVELATVRTGRTTRGIWKLECHKGPFETVQRGAIGRASHVQIETGFNYFKPTCTLSARVASPSRAVVAVVLSD